jgi:hypothetical protein
VTYFTSCFLAADVLYLLLTYGAGESRRNSNAASMGTDKLAISAASAATSASLASMRETVKGTPCASPSKKEEQGTREVSPAAQYIYIHIYIYIYIYIYTYRHNIYIHTSSINICKHTDIILHILGIAACRIHHAPRNDEPQHLYPHALRDRDTLLR